MLRAAGRRSAFSNPGGPRSSMRCVRYVLIALVLVGALGPRLAADEADEAGETDPAVEAAKREMVLRAKIPKAIERGAAPSQKQTFAGALEI